ncbi:MAG: zinc ribbon domain-containing protein [Emergencia sp.]|nr:zinc ribbon domain-containing protein [Emergencia sp.]
MKFCPECGTNVEGMKFCPECGTNLKEFTPAEDSSLDIEEISDYDDISYEEYVDDSWQAPQEESVSAEGSPDETWRPPAEFYERRKKTYTVKNAQLKLARELGIANTAEEITIAGGMYTRTGNCKLAYVIGSDIYFVTTSISKKEVKKISQDDPQASQLFNPNKLKLDTKEIVGFKFGAIDCELPIDLKKASCVELEIIMLIAPDYAEQYYKENLFEVIRTPKNNDVDTQVKEFVTSKMNDAGTQAKEFVTSKMIEKQREREKIKEYERNKIPYCPKCHSTSLSANKKGFGIGKAVAGAYLTGGIGLVAGNINAKKVRLTCMNCGYQFWPGKK